MPIPSHWLTAPRVRRLADALTALPSRPPGLTDTDCKLRLWRTCGGPMDDVPTMIAVLTHAELVTRDTTAIRLTPAGRRIAAQQRAQGTQPLALALIRAGLLHDQAHRLIANFSADPSLGLTCRLAEARPIAPQLLGLLQQWPTVRTTGASITIPADLVAELTAGWALLPPPDPDDANLAIRRKSIGNRAELYSWQLERLNAAEPSDIAWVALDDDTLGYDLEDRASTPHRRIEVKGSGGRLTRFFLSDNEWRKAQQRPATYEVHFWGGIDLTRPTAEEYHALREDGYPLVFVDLPTLISSGILETVPDRWKVTGPYPRVT